MKPTARLFLRILPLTLLLGASQILPAAPPVAESLPEEMGITRGVICLVGNPGTDSSYVTDLAESSELTLFVQAPDPETADRIREQSREKQLLGKRIFVAEGTDRIQLADNVADGIIVFEGSKISRKECLRAIRPRAIARLAGGEKLIKPVPDGYDDWTHPFHRPDNNTQSRDRFVKGQFRTQFIAEPKFSPMPQQTVIAGGRMYKAMGHIAHKANGNEHLNTLLGINAFNGTILWRRPLPDGFMIHRNTMIATDDALYLGDDMSCKIIDGETGEVRDEITIPGELSDGPTWKWMGIKDNILYALVGHAEVKVETKTSDSPGIGHWPWGMWKGHEYADPETSFGYGRTLVAVDLDSREVLWHYRDEDYLDARAIVMNRDKIIFYIPEKCLGAIDPANGKLLWKNSSSDLLTAIGPNGRAQHYMTGYATTTYMKCTDKQVFFAGPQRKKMVVASADDGNLLWTYPVGNLQLVLREDAAFAAGQQGTSGVKLDYLTGEVLAEFPARRACTRATGCADSIFFRASGGTVRIMTDSTVSARHIAPMRPPCQDGVLISNGHLYWGPWMCGCQLSLYGNIGLAPTSEPFTDPVEVFASAFQTYGDDWNRAAPLDGAETDWAQYRGNGSRTDASPITLPESVALKWTRKISSGVMATAPVCSGGLVFVADRSGAIRAIESETGDTAWESFAGGPVYYPPTVSHDRVFVGAADGRVYAYEAKTGRKLWSFRVSPADQLIPVFGQLISSWPVAGGVVASDDTIYAAAGITHYDGTYVVALDPVTGELKASNTSSGVIAEEVDNGISMQGNLRIRDGELQFLGGGVYEWARYDLETLECLNDPKIQVTSEYRTAFYPYYPNYNRYVSLEHTLEDNRELVHYANYEGRYFIDLTLRKPRSPETKQIWQDAAGEFIRRANRSRGVTSKERDIWVDPAKRRFTGFIVADNHLLATGHPEEKTDSAFLAAIDVDSGKDLWHHELPALAVKGGMALDSNGRIFVVTEAGELLSFAP